jgi:hypothetical protein
MKKILAILLLLICSITQAQDLNCTIEVRSDIIQASNKEIFTDLENAVSQFINQRKWISDKIQPQEKINCNIVINITSSRPVYGTTYNTPIFSHFDQEWSFQYAQFQSLDYQENADVMKLTTLLAFYANVIIGMDFDSFYPEGGQPYFNKALQIRNLSQSSSGWGPSAGSGNRNKFYIIDQLMDDRFRPLRSASFQYHMQGMDKFKDDNGTSRKEIFESLEKIRSIQELLPNSVIFKIFFQAKRQELISIFKQAEPGLKNRAIELLGKLDPSNVTNYAKIKS